MNLSVISEVSLELPTYKYRISARCQLIQQLFCQYRIWKFGINTSWSLLLCQKLRMRSYFNAQMVWSSQNFQCRQRVRFHGLKHFEYINMHDAVVLIMYFCLFRNTLSILILLYYFVCLSHLTCLVSSYFWFHKYMLCYCITYSSHTKCVHSLSHVKRNAALCYIPMETDRFQHLVIGDMK